ncbi:hypothetical protein MLD38_019866 [Melastoma candidum]|uniref:Uncharacterized protein n=1 Tax=Melastoma candidum TaxID=119954 RepID=A0ACB9QC45_9MYRT|nr:hypothetical protein MLD38_019866 [Melastoma candidum]
MTALLGLTNWIIPGVSRLLRHCECLETLAVNFYPCRDDKLKFFGAKMQEAYGFDEGSCGSSFRGSNGCRQRHLKKVTVQGFVTDLLSIQFIVFLLSNASCLEELEISARKPPRYSVGRYLLSNEIRLTQEDRVRFRRRVLEIPKASKLVVIRFTR